MFIILFILFIGIPLLKESIENQSYREECRRRGYDTYYADPIGGEEGDMIRIFYQEDWRNRTLEEETYLQGIFAVEETEE